MNLPRPLGFASLAVVLVAFAPPLDQPAFSPAEGARLTKTFVVGGDFSLDEFSAIVDGQDIGAMLGSMEMSLEVQNTVTVTDTYVSSDGGRPEKLERTFDSLEGLTTVALTTDFGGEDQDMSSESELEGITVVFTWNDEEGEYEVEIEGEDDDEELLDGLVEDMDLRVFLPPGEVSVDDTWDVDLELLGDVAFPGGNLKILPEDLDEGGEDMDVFDEIFGEDFGEYLSELLEGTCVCTYKGVSEEEGLAEINVAIEIGSAADLTDMLTQILESVADEVGEEIPFSIELADLNLDFEGEGVLMWDLENGRISSFELNADMIVAADLGVSGDMDGASQSAELSMEMSGTYEYTVETEE